MGQATFLVLIVILCGCNGQPPAAVFLTDPHDQAPAGDSADGVSGSLTQRHDFGVSKPSVTLKHDFVIANKTASDWTLAGVKTDCSCTIATPDWKVIPAGQKKSVTVELQTGSAIRFQPVTHTVEVKFRDTSLEPVRLSVSALVRDVLYITPERVVLADVGQGTTVTRSIIVSNFGEQKISPPKFIASVPWITSAKPVSETVDQRMHFVKQEGQAVFKDAVRKMAEASLLAGEKAGLLNEDIDLFIPHQANIRIIEAAQARLGLPDSKVIKNIATYGNTTAATVPLGIYTALEEKRLKKGDHLLMTSVGAGFTVGSAVLRWSNLAL